MKYLICLKIGFSSQDRFANRWQVGSNSEANSVVLGLGRVECSVGVRIQSIGLFSGYAGTYQGVLGNTPAKLLAPPHVRKWSLVSGCCRQVGHSGKGQSPALWSHRWVGRKPYIHRRIIRWWLGESVVKALPNSVHAMDAWYVGWSFSRWVRCFMETSSV